MTNQSGGGGSSALAGDSDVGITSPANNDLLHYLTADGKWHNVPLLTAVDARLSGDVTMTTAGTAYDTVTTGTLPAGAYLVVARLAVVTPTAGASVNGQLWDGTSTVDSAEATENMNSSEVLIPLQGVYAAPGGTVLKITARSTVASSVAKASPVTYGLGTSTTRLMLLRIA